MEWRREAGPKPESPAEPTTEGDLLYGTHSERLIEASISARDAHLLVPLTFQIRWARK